MKKLLFFVSEDWYFCSHRLELAAEAVRKGYHVSVLCNVDKHREVIEAKGVRVIPLRIDRTNTGVFSNLALLRLVIQSIRQIKPDILHNVAQKPVLIGTLAARICATKRVVNALGGLGFIFTSTAIKAKLLRPLFTLAYKWLLNHRSSTLIVQNSDDRHFFSDYVGLQGKRLVLIRGAGVDTSEYAYTPLPEGKVTKVVLVARMLKDKGIREFIAAAKLINDKTQFARFWLVGDIDVKNPNAFVEAELTELVSQAGVEWLGRRNDIKKIWQDSHISVLPSYREGLPKSLLESASVGRPIVTTDVPGCREVVADGYNGFLVPKGAIKSLANRILTLIEDRASCITMGQRSREMVEKHFSTARVISETLELYGEESVDQLKN